MASLICPRDKAENPAQALACSKCGGKLSRLAEGQVFVQRYRVLSCLGQTETGFRYLTQFARTGAACVVSEIFPSAKGDRARLTRFDRAARYLIDARPHCLVPVLEHFSHRSCFYTVEAVPERASLREAIEKRGSFPEERANALLDTLLAGLKEVYSLDPPVYVGSLDAEKILVNGDRSPALFRESCYISDTVRNQNPPPAGEVFGKDLYGSVQATVAALAGSVSPDSQRVENTVANVKDLAFGCTLDWVLHANGKRPGSLQKLEQFRGLVSSAKSAMDGGQAGKAVELLDHAHQMSGSKRVQTALETLEKPESAKPAPPLVEPPAPPPPPPPAPAGQQWVCSCNTTNAADAKFCQRCGKPKDGKSPSQPQAVVASPQPTVGTATPKSRQKALLWISLAAVLAIALWIWGSGSAMRNFDAAIQKGQLVSPIGQSAYDYYRKIAQSEGMNSPKVHAMNAKARPPLQQMSNEQFERWHRASDLSQDNWKDLANAENWLVSMDPSDAVSEARKEYTNAQLLFIQTRFSDALDGFQRALQYQPNWDTALMGVGKSCFRLRRAYCTEEYYNRAKQVSPDWIWPHRNLMELYLAPPLMKLPTACAEYRTLMNLSASMNPPPFDRDAIQRRMSGPCSKY
jgi:ribosomal protein L40E